MMRYVPSRGVTLATLMISATLTGCGHSEDEWQAQLARYNQCRGDLDQQVAAARARVAELEGQLRAAGVETSKLTATLQDRERALAEYQTRARQLEQIKARFELLRRKLDELTRLGLAVRIRHNRMVISLPGDVLFDTGKDTLKKDGEEILKKVASVIRSDPALMQRTYQVAGSTDNQPLQGGPYHDNWGLSLMRARSVLVYLIGPQGNLPKDRWSAAGFGDTDPVASNATKEGQQKNRRCDLVVLPSVEEMIDLKSLAGN
jgi:chemotaxis protein MotB